MTRKMLSKRTLVFVMALFFAALGAVNANVALSPLFSDHMVLQRDKPIPVYGTALPGENVTVSYNGQSRSTTADSLGYWMVNLPAMSAKTTGGNFVVTGNNTVTLTDVVVGDVWICSGQSNMAFSLGGCNRQTEDVSTANFPGLRTFWAPLNNTGEPTKNITGNWTVCSPSTAGGFSAVAFYFGRKLYQDQNATVPIGLLATTVGGTCIDPWLAPEGCTDIPTIQPIFSQSILPWGPFCLFNGMVYPLAPYAVKGGIWYQGESRETTSQSADSYYLKEKALINGWQRLWGMDELPFYIVQIANYNTGGTSGPTPDTGATFADTRLQQTNILGLPHTGMAVTIDIGNSTDIHPTDKLDVGERLAFWALKNDYGRSSLVTSGPILKDVTVSGSTLVCSFDYVGSGLMVGSKTPYQPTQEVVGGTLQKFAIAGSTGSWYWATATISGNTVVVSSPSVSAPRKVAYAYWSDPTGANLYNKDGLPASPFYVDDVTAKYSVTASAGAGGSISPVGSSTYLKRATALYKITPDAGYYIQDVKVDGVSVGSVKTYTFDPLYANHTISASFAATAPNYTVTASATAGGTISPSGSVSVAQGGSQGFVATPNAGCNVTLSVDGQPMGQRNYFTFSSVRSNHTVSATFTTTINASAGYGGSISPSGTAVVGYGSSKTFTIAPLAGFSISKVTVDGVNVGAVSSYTFNNVTTSHSISASFAGTGGSGSVPQTNQLLFSYLTDTLPASGAISTWSSYLPAGKTLSAMGTPTVETIDSRKFSKNIYNDFDGFNAGAYSSPITCTGASIVVVAKPTRFGTDAGWTSIVDAFYDRLVLGILNGSGRICVRRNGTVDYSTDSLPDGQTTILSLVAQSNGTYKVYANGTLMMSNTGISDLTSLVPGVAGGFANNINIGRNQPDGWTTFNGYIGDVFFYKTALSDTERVQLETYLVNRLAGTVGTAYTITSSAGVGGSISPAGSVAVNSGANQTFTITPSAGYAIANVLVDGASVGAVSSYTFTNVTANHTISATFSGGPTTYTITATAGSGGSINPSGSVSVVSGANQTFTVSPNTGYVISDVLVDGASVGAVSSYTFNNVTTNHTISVSFSANSSGIPRTGDLLFSCVTDSLPASGSTGAWATYMPSGSNLTSIGAPTVEARAGVKWEKNLYANGDGYLFGTFTSPIPCNGASIVVATRPVRYASSGGWTSIVDAFYSNLVLGIRNDTGEICVWRNGVLNNTGAFVPDGQKTILGLVVQPDGTYKVYANGTQVFSMTTANAFTQLTPGTYAFQQCINVGRNNPDGWTTYNGNIGDVFFYKVALSDSERQQLEAALTTKFGATSASFTINSSAGVGGTISPSGDIAVASGADKTFTITPSVGYAISDVKVDGSSVGAVSTYTFSNVVAAHSIAVTFSELAKTPVSGKVTNQQTGAGISGAAVYFSTTANAAVSPAYVVYTDASGNYSLSVSSGTWYLSSSQTGYISSSDLTLAVNGTALTNNNFALTPSGRNIPKMDKLLFSVVTDSLPASGDAGAWPSYHPKGITLTPMQSPTVELINGVKTEKNLIGSGATPWASTDNDGYQVGTYTSPIACNGASIVSAVKPVRDPYAAGWTSIVDAFYNNLVLGIHNESGQVCVWRNGAILNTGAIIPDGQMTVLSLIVQPDGTYKVYANGTKIVDVTTPSSYTQIAPGNEAYQRNIYIGRGIDWWSTFNGNIGDVFFYKTALSDAERAQLELDLRDKFLPPSYQDVTSMADLRSKPDGALVRLTNAATVIYAPRDASGARSTLFFYIGEAQGKGGLKVVETSSDTLTIGNSVANLIGYVRKPAGKEMYLELTTAPAGSGNNPIAPLGINNRTALSDAKVATNAVKVWGKVKSINGTTSFDISDGYNASDLTVMISGVQLPADFGESKTVVVTGIASKNDAGQSVIYAQDIE